MKRIFLLPLVLAIAAAAHGAPGIGLSWTAAPECTAQTPCNYVLLRVAVPAGTAACPTVEAAYTVLAMTQPQATSYVDLTATAGETWCYAARTRQAGATGPLSAPTLPVLLPLPPAAPTNLTATPPTGSL